MTPAVTRGHWHIPWLHGLPPHWEVVSSKKLFSARKELARDHDQQLAATQAYGVISQKEFERRAGRQVVQITQNLDKRRHVEKNDFVISMRSFQGGLERAWDTGCIRSSYVVLRPNSQVDASFFQYLFKSYHYIQALQTTSGFIRDGQDLNMSNFALVDLPLPPLDEQMLLARYLNWHGTQTTKLIRAKQSQLKLVAEEREALTHDVVSSPGTQQIRLGNVVDHVFRSVERESTKTYIPVGLYNRGRGIFQKPATPGDDLGDSTFSWIEEGDLILSGQFAWEGAVALAGTDEAGCIASHRYHILRGKEDLVQTIYLSSVLRTRFGHLLLNEHSRGAAGRNRPLNIRTLLKEKIPVPAQSEQARLVELVTLEKRLASSIAKFADRLREFRTRLIADVVTGKLDVRAAAASLPETVELEPIDDLVEGDDLDEAVDDAENEEVAA